MDLVKRLAHPLFKPYPSNASDAESSLTTLYLPLQRKDAD
jgi:hypothetical protein